MFGTIGSVVSSLYGFHLSPCQGEDRSHNVQVNRNLSVSYLFILFFSFLINATVASFPVHANL